MLQKLHERANRIVNSTAVDGAAHNKIVASPAIIRTVSGVGSQGASIVGRDDQADSITKPLCVSSFLSERHPRHR